MSNPLSYATAEFMAQQRSSTDPTQATLAILRVFLEDGRDEGRTGYADVLEDLQPQTS